MARACVRVGVEYERVFFPLHCAIFADNFRFRGILRPRARGDLWMRACKGASGHLCGERVMQMKTERENECRKC